MTEASLSITVTAAALVKHAQPSRVLDLGSTGPWAEAFRQAGVTDVVTVRPPGSGTADAPAPVFHDLRLPFVADRRFDLAICIGGGTDLPSSAADSLVSSLTRAAPVVAFAAPHPGLAPPGAPNPRWPGWWDSLFELQGLVPHDIVRVELWEDERVDLLTRSLTVYAPAGYLPDAALPASAVRSAVHQEVHHHAVAQSAEQRRDEVARLNAALLDADVDAGGLRQLVLSLRGELERAEREGKEEVGAGDGTGDNRALGWRLRCFDLEERVAVLAAAVNAERNTLRGCRERLQGHEVRATNPSAAVTRWASRALPIRRRFRPVLGLPADLLDEDYYQRRYVDVATSRFSPLWHYRRSGSRDGRSPHRLFDVDWYLERNPDVASAGLPAVEHYLRHGWREGRDPHPLFDGTWYCEAHDLGRWSRSPLEHYLERGRREDLSPHPLFDPAWYRDQNDGTLPLSIDTFAHFDERGWMEGRDPHPLFNVGWYLAHSPGGVNAGANPLEHYLRVGWREGSDPNPMFAVTYYRQVNGGVLGVDEEPLGHFVKKGGAAGLATSQLFDTTWYVTRHPEAAGAGNPLTYFITVGLPKGHRGAPDRGPGREYDRSTPL